MDQVDFKVVPCAGCGAKNRIPLDKMGVLAKCGKCGSPIQTDQEKSSATDAFLLRCTECHAKNRIPHDKISAGAKCGKCSSPLKTHVLFSGEPIMVTDGNFESEVLESPLPALILAWAPWCPACRTVLPVIDDFAKDAKGKLRVGKLNVDQNPLLSSKYSILSVPQLFIFDNGQLKENMPGAMQKHEIMMKMAQYI